MYMLCPLQARTPGRKWRQPLTASGSRPSTSSRQSARSTPSSTSPRSSGSTRPSTRRRSSTTARLHRSRTTARSHVSGFSNVLYGSSAAYQQGQWYFGCVLKKRRKCNDFFLTLFNPPRLVKIVFLKVTCDLPTPQNCRLGAALNYILINAS